MEFALCARILFFVKKAGNKKDNLSFIFNMHNRKTRFCDIVLHHDENSSR